MMMSPSARSARFLWRDTKGATAVEFAAVFPLFLLVVVGIVAFGCYFGMAHSVQQIASEAARASIGGMDNDERRTLAEGVIRVHAANYPLIRPESISLQAGPGANPDMFEVRVSYDSSSSPIWAFRGLLPLPSSTIERRAVIRRGGY